MPEIGAHPDEQFDRGRLARSGRPDQGRLAVQSRMVDAGASCHEFRDDRVMSAGCGKEQGADAVRVGLVNIRAPVKQEADHSGVSRARRSQ